MWINNFIALIITFVVALAWLRLNDFFAMRGWVSSRASRKVIHIGTGPLFVLCWLLFNEAASARFLAALVPFAITVQFALVGLGIMKDESTVQGMSRSGDRREILRGPLYYGIVFVLLTLVFWKESPVGIVALMMICGGDGLAEILGRKYGARKLPWSKTKSWAGSFGFLLGGWLLSVLTLEAFILAGVFAAPITAYLLPITIISLVSTGVESLTPNDLDNITVPAAAVVLGLMLF